MILRRMRQMSNEKRVYSLLKSEKISVGRGEDGANLCSIPHNENKEVYNVNSYSFRIAFKSFWKKEYGELLNDKEVQEIISILEVECYESKNKIQRNHRIYTKGRMLIYQLNTDNNTSVRIEDGECEIEETPDFMFYTDRNFKNQVEPDLNVMPEELLPYIRKHFNVKDEDDVILISILIVSSMLADFHEKAIKIGRVLGIEEDKISDILFQNRLNLSLSILESSSIAICLKELMADKYEYVNTPTECLNELKHIALQKGIDKSTLPKDGSRLTKALILIRDELSEVYGLDFEQKRGKERRYVITNRNLEEEFDEE